MRAHQPEEIHKEFVEAFNAGDLEALVALYEPEAVFVVDGNRPVIGIEAIREAYRGFLAAHPKISLETRGIYRRGDDIALLHGRWKLTGTGPDGAEVSREGRNTEVVRRQADGSWKFIIDNPLTPE